MAIHHDIADALQKAATRRHRDTALRKEVQKRALLAEEYHTLQRQLNDTQFIQPVDADTTKANIYYIKKRFIRFCITNHYGDWRTAIQPRHCDKGFIMAFLHWICERYLQPRRKRSKKKTVNQYWRDFKMLYRRCNDGKFVNLIHCAEIRKYINTELKSKFDLDDQPGSKPVMNVDDILLGLGHHWTRRQGVFPTEDDAHDFATIILFQSYSACRPAELVDGTKKKGTGDPLLDDPAVECSKDSGRATDDSIAELCGQQPPFSEEKENRQSTTEASYETASDADCDDFAIEGDERRVDGYDTSDTEYSDADKEDIDMLQPEQESQPTVALEQDEDPEKARLHKALCYEDIVLWIAKDPNGGRRDVLTMEVLLRYHKGADNKPKPTVFQFREHPLPILCPISHILVRAARDKAVDVDGFTHATPFFSTKIGRAGTKVNWKTSMLKTPVFRRSIRTAAGGWEKSRTDPMKYSTYAFYLNRLGSELGSEDRWTSYCMRRGHANALLKVAPGSIVDQAMRHDPMTGCLANAYLNQRVQFNTQDAFLERDPSADGLTRVFSHMSIRCNPEVPRNIPLVELAKLPPDAEVERLTTEVNRTAIRLRQQYGFIKNAPAEENSGYKRLRDDLRNAKKQFREDMTSVYQEAYRRRMHNEELERQLSGRAAEEKAGPSVEYQLAERTYLQPILSDFRTDIGDEEITARKIRAIDGMIRLAGCREVRQLRPISTHDTNMASSPEEAESAMNIESEPFEGIPFRLEKTQCIFCIGNLKLSHAARTRKFKRVSHMMDHVENVHLRHEECKDKFVCWHPDCRHLGDFLTSLEHFKNHVLTEHNVPLRA